MFSDMNTKLILIKNVTAMMSRDSNLNSDRKIAKRCRELGAKISARAVGYMLDPKDPKQPKLDSIAAVAKAFNVPAWALLCRNFDPEKKAQKPIPPPEIVALAERILLNREALSEVFGETVPAGPIEGARVPVTVQQPTKTREYERAVKRRR